MGTCCTKHPGDSQAGEVLKDAGEVIPQRMKVNSAFNGEPDFESRGMRLVTSMPEATDQVVKVVTDKIGDFQWDKLPKYEDPDIQQVGPLLFEDSGAVYRGQMKNWQRYGAGVQVWKDGSKYEGEWCNDKAKGYGRLTHADGDVYEGEWKNDIACGKGKYYHVQGAMYDGDWVDDCQQGQGREEWPDGTYYEGSYLNGKKEGKGKFYWVDGSYYFGEFRDNTINGRGSSV